MIRFQEMIDHFMMLIAIIQFWSRYFIVGSRHIYLPKTTIELKNQHFVPQSYIWGLQSIEIGNMTMVHSVAFWVVLWFQVCSLPTFTVVQNMYQEGFWVDRVSSWVLTALALWTFIGFNNHFTDENDNNPWLRLYLGENTNGCSSKWKPLPSPKF